MSKYNQCTSHTWPKKPTNNIPTTVSVQSSPTVARCAAVRSLKPYLHAGTGNTVASRNSTKSRNSLVSYSSRPPPRPILPNPTEYTSATLEGQLSAAQDDHSKITCSIQGSYNSNANISENSSRKSPGLGIPPVPPDIQDLGTWLDTHFHAMLRVEEDHLKEFLYKHLKLENYILLEKIASYSPKEFLQTLGDMTYERNQKLLLELSTIFTFVVESMKGSSLAWNYNYYLDLRFQAKRSYSQFPRSSDLARTRNNLTLSDHTKAVCSLFLTFQQGVPPSKGAPY